MEQSNKTFLPFFVVGDAAPARHGAVTGRGQDERNAHRGDPRGRARFGSRGRRRVPRVCERAHFGCHAASTACFLGRRGLSVLRRASADAVRRVPRGTWCGCEWPTAGLENARSVGPSRRTAFAGCAAVSRGRGWRANGCCGLARKKVREALPGTRHFEFRRSNRRSSGGWKAGATAWT
jgi:hypothetical protein